MKGVIFDFDGLIVDTESIWYEVYKETVLEYGVELALEEFAKVIGTTDEVLYAYLEKHATKPFTRDDIEKAAHELYKTKIDTLTLREGVEEYLKEAKELGLKIGLASSSSRAWVTSYLKKYKILEYFEVIRTKDDVAKVKPDPELYIQALKGLDIAPEEAIAFEDSVNGSTAAIKAGISCVIVPNPVTEQLAFTSYSYRLSSMNEMPLSTLLDKINK
ncbi:HAD family hydrolase [Bacillus luteolus]|uniref:HAD family hydrolase n=1 Tax=Litchfieldia luteola TaxID=682179 RepID=A0ABR9QEW4_9BACI|nr:HAD family hydrolase [Cytobacillus luteolus]MBE4907020.1 HAD family hydrolase [Cytobacillus luteolus]